MDISDIRNSLDGLKSILGVNPADSTHVNKSAGNSPNTPLDSMSDHATLSSAASQVASAAADSSVRMDKVAGVQAALAAGTYAVPASAVASSVVDSMLNQD